MVGLDPETLLDAKLDPECLPPIEAMDLFSYLVMDTSFYTKEQFKASKNLESFNFLVSGFITNAQEVKISDKYVVTGKLRHNQRMNNPLPPISVISSNEGNVLSAHCMGRKSGLAEPCFHVAGALFYTEAWPRPISTQMKSYWIIPSYVKEVSYAPISEINFKSARRLKQDLDHAINSNPSTASNTCTPPRAITHNNDSKVPGISPTDEEMEILSFMHSHADQFIFKSRNIPTVPDLFSSDNLELFYPDPFNEGNEVELKITPDRKQGSNVEQQVGLGELGHL